MCALPPAEQRADGAEAKSRAGFDVEEDGHAAQMLRLALLVDHQTRTQSGRNVTWYAVP